MATQQVFDWIQADLQLSKPISNFETDFSNGQLFGEILVHYGVLPSADAFSKKTNKEATVNNFYLVEDALRKLKIKFDGRMVHNIVQQERGAALRLLYQIKLACEKHARVEMPDDPSLLSQTGLMNGKMHQILKKKQDKVHEMSTGIAPRASMATMGGKDIRTSNQVMQDKRVISYDVAKKELYDKADKDQKFDDSNKFYKQQDLRTINRQKLAENQEFMKEWDQEGKKNWQINTQKRIEGIAKVKYFENREVNLWRDKLGKEFLKANEECQEGFIEFDKNLQKLGIEQHTDMDAAIQRQEEKKGIPPGQIQNFSYAATMNKIKETKKNTDFAGKERERRRRKMQVDGITAQQKLDAQKSEASLIEKLLSITKSSHETAYTDKRVKACKMVATENRKIKAENIEEHRQAQDEIAEKVRIEENKTVQIQRKEDDKIRRTVTQKRRTEHHVEKRTLNVEIASGLVDLLLDLTDETFDEIEQNQKHQIQRSTWRQFIKIFKDGNKVSLRNMKSQPKIVEEKVPVKKQNTLELANMTDKITAYSLLKDNFDDPSMKVFYEYLCQCGQFQFSSIDMVQYQKFQEDFQSELANSQNLLPKKLLTNQPLVDEFHKILGQLPRPESQIDLRMPTHLTFKVAILGRAQAGKKTLSEQIVKKLGANVRIFQLDKILVEAIEYAAPKKDKEEAVVVDPKAAAKAKGKAPAAATEHANTDIFEGKDTVQYKKLAEHLKSTYLTQDFKTGHAVDLIEQVPDDQLLVDIIVERIALQYQKSEIQGDRADSPDPTATKQTVGDIFGIDELMQSVKKERKLLQEIKELDEANAGAPVDPKAKGKAKGGPDPEKLQKDLEELRLFKADGWILLDFPRTLNQAKLLEDKLSGFRSIQDAPKSIEQEQSETWQKLITPDTFPVGAEQENAKESGFDGWVFMGTTENACLERVTGRKIDPTTQVIYHPESNPVPEDPKIKERLQDYSDEVGNSERMVKNHKLYNKRLQALKLWSHQFGLVDQGTCKVPLNLEMPESVLNKEETFDKVMESIDGILEYKQKEFDVNRKACHAKLDLQEADSSSMEKIIATENNTTGDKVGQETPNIQDLKNTLFSKQSNLEVAGAGASSQAGSTLRSQIRRKTMQRVFEINEIQRSQKLETMMDEYFQKGLETFKSLGNQRSRIFHLLNETQKQFISFISEGSTLQKRIHEFCDSYNRFCTEYPDLWQQEDTKTELQNRADILSGQLWQLILQRKDDALNERQNQIENGFARIEKVKLLHQIAALLEQEYARLHACVNVATGWVLNEDLDLTGLCKKLVERDVSVYEPATSSQDASSPVLFQLMTYMLNTVQQLSSEQFIMQSSPEVRKAITTERMNFNVRVNSLRLSCLYQLEEINYYCDQVFTCLDDWVVEAVKRDNKSCQRIIKYLKQQIDQNVTYMETPDVNSGELVQIIQTIKFEEGPPRYMLEPRSGRSCYDSRFDLGNLEEIYKMLKQYAVGDLLDVHTFTGIMIQNYQAHRVPSKWVDGTFSNTMKLADIFSTRPLINEMPEDKYSGLGMMTISGTASSGQAAAQSENLVDWKLIFAMMLLSSSQVATESNLNSYEEKLKQKGMMISLSDFIDVDAWFDRTEGATSVSKLLRAVNSSGESEDEQDDTEEDFTVAAETSKMIAQRLSTVKRLLWKVFKRTNEDGLRTDEFIQAMRKLSDVCQQHILYGALVL